MTDGERLVWASSYALAFDRSGDAIDAARVAARVVEKLREEALRQLPKGELTPSQIDERDFLDEIVSVP